MASSIVKSAVQQLGNLAVEEAKYLYKVRGKIESLQTELEWMECFLRDADTRQHQEKVICKWVSQVRDIAYDAEDIIQRYLHEVSHHRKDGAMNTLKWICCIIGKCDAWTLHCLGSDIDDLIVKISELTSRLQRYGIQIINPNRSLDYNTMVREEKRTYSHIVEDVVGLTTDINEVVDALLQNDHKFISISGTGGLGKTTLARKVFQHKDVRDHFKNNCVWVYISKEFEKNNIFREILKGLDKDEDVTDAEVLPGKIQELLKRKKCFVVLDDIWNVRDWENIKVAFESTEEDFPSKILLTTRNQSLLEHVDPSGYNHSLNLLSADDGWELLKLKAFRKHGSTGGGSSVDSHEQNEPQDDEVDIVQMEKLGREMLKHCKGLPLAIVVLGGILSTKKTLFEWKDVQKNISSYLRSDMEEAAGRNSLAVLELSYHDLPYYLKPCFLYLGNFPEDYEIPTLRLYHLWQAEGLLVIEGEAKKRRGSIYDIGEMYLNDLVQRSMVQVGRRGAGGRIRSCRVHDVMRDMCLRKCEEVSFLSIIECTREDIQCMMATSAIENYKLRRCAALHVKDDDLAADEHYGQHGEKLACLRSLLVFELDDYVTIDFFHWKIASRKMWKSFALIRVLYLEKSAIYSVDGVEHLIHLRYLCLKHTSVTSLPPRFYDLKYLETLDLRVWCMGLLNKFHKMKRLIHLYLPRRYEVKGGERLSFLQASQMETLKSFDPGECEAKDLMQMTNLRLFSIIGDYTFEDKDVLKEVLESPVMINPGQLINSFRLEVNVAALSEEEPAWRQLARLPNFNTLRLEGRNGSNYEHIVDILLVNSLTHVTLNGCDIGEAGGILRLGDLPNLQQLSLDGGVVVQGNKMTFSADSFQQLKTLFIKGQEDLEEWEVGDKALPNLQTLYMSGCTKLSKLPDGLPPSVNITCRNPCIKGIEKYKTCPNYKSRTS